jgi:hypothetical protein
VSFTIVPGEQRTPAWYQARCGRLTGSVAHHVTARGKHGEAFGRRDLRYKLALERIIGVPEPDDYQSFDMRRGQELEPAAIAAYEAATGRTVEKTGFISHNELPIGCSLDGHHGGFQTLLEVKCCKPALQVQRWHNRVEFIAEHWAQCAHNLWATDAASVELVSFSPHLPPNLRLLRVTVTRRNARLEEYISAAERFLADVERTVQEVQALAEAAA